VPSRLPGSACCLLALLAVVVGSLDESAAETTVASSVWAELAPGLELGRFPVKVSGDPADAQVTVLRADPRHWELCLLAASAETHGRPRTAADWCRQNDLVAAINAGMFHPDFLTHVGFMACGDHLNSGAANHYHSAAAFAPRDSALTPFRIFDLDEVELANVAQGYNCVVQNLRLIKRPGLNRWSPQPRRWSEAALGEDSRGRILFIFCRSPQSMYDLNHVLLELPLDLVCAQHLEGGPEAQLYLHHGAIELELVGSYESGFHESDDNRAAWPVPNVLGLIPRHP
jgi:hypothetical protein